jgi:hypothetical protein
MCEIEKVGDLKSQNLGIKNCLRNTSIKKYWYQEISYWFGQNFSVVDEKVQD